MTEAERRLWQDAQTNKTTLAMCLAARDKCSLDAATEAVEDCQNAIDEALAEDNPDLDEIEGIIMDCLGLEPDYLMAFLPI